MLYDIGYFFFLIKALFCFLIGCLQVNGTCTVDLGRWKQEMEELVCFEKILANPDFKLLVLE